jgi:hypothetical protein
MPAGIGTDRADADAKERRNTSNAVIEPIARGPTIFGGALRAFDATAPGWRRRVRRLSAALGHPSIKKEK